MKAIISLTQSGKTVENISKFRPNLPIIACTPCENVFHKLSMLYDVYPVLDNSYNKIEDANKNSLKKAIETKMVKKGDKVVLVSGQIANKSGSNLMIIKKL